MNKYYVYIMTNHTNTALYVDVTNNLGRRAFEHQQQYTNGFAEKYNMYKVVYAEEIQDSTTAIIREKQIKRWSREKKNKLINSINPNWIDLLKS